MCGRVLAGNLVDIDRVGSVEVGVRGEAVAGMIEDVRTDIEGQGSEQSMPVLTHRGPRWYGCSCPSRSASCKFVLDQLDREVSCTFHQTHLKLSLC